MRYIKKIPEQLNAIPQNLIAFIKTHKDEIFKWGYTIFSIVIALLIPMLIVVAIIVGIVSLIDAHPTAFLILLAFFVCFIVIIGGLVWLGFMQKQPPKSNLPTSDEKFMQAMEKTYIRIANGVVFNLFMKMTSIYPLLAPTRINDMYSPSRARIDDNIPVYYYVLIKTATDIDLDAVEVSFSEELDRMMYDGEAHGLSRNTTQINGVEMSALQIKNIKDYGNYIEVGIVITSDYYMKAKEADGRARLETGHKEVNTVDDYFI